MSLLLRYIQLFGSIYGAPDCKKIAWKVAKFNNKKYLCVIRTKAREPTIYHIKVDWETHQIYVKYRDKLSRLMAGPDRSPERWLITQADYKGWRALKSCHSEFHRILWCGLIKEETV